jgi:hypothetical protein
MAAAMALGQEVRVSSTRVVLESSPGFELSAATTRPSASYDVSTDGERLLLIESSGAGAGIGTAESSVLVLNVFEELRERAGG